MTTEARRTFGAWRDAQSDWLKALAAMHAALDAQDAAESAAGAAKSAAFADVTPRIQAIDGDPTPALSGRAWAHAMDTRDLNVAADAAIDAELDAWLIAVDAWHAHQDAAYCDA